MSKRTSSRTEYLVLVVAVRRTETTDSSPSSSAFAAAAPIGDRDTSPGLAKVEPGPFPFRALKAGGQ